jgi:hypothetical protein
VSHYDVLGVAPVADAATVREAFLSLARRHHPDLTGGDAARMRRINEAWATLGDPVRRARYDRALAAAAAPTPRPAPPAEGRAADDLAADLADDRPVHPATVRLPPWLSLLPVALFAAATGAGVVGLVFASELLLGLAFMAFVLSCLSFLAAPFVALLTARTRGGRSPSRQ